MEQLETRPGASREAISAMLEALGTKLPSDYLEFLSMSNGATGLGPNLYVLLYRADEVPIHTTGCDVPEFPRGLVIIGGDGCGDLLGIDHRVGDPALMEYVWGDAITLDCDHFCYRGKSFVELLEYLDSYYGSMDEPGD